MRESVSHLVVQCLVLAGAVVFAGTPGFGQPLVDNLPVTNSTIESMVQDGSMLYIGGWFTYAGPNTGRGVMLNTTSGTYDPTFPKVNGIINVCVSDSNGGWYIGGAFTKVGNTYRSNLAHIKSDNTVDASWNPNPNAEVKTIAFYGSTVYVGGLFTNIGGVARAMIGAVDAITGVTTAWDPDIEPIDPLGGVVGVWGIVPTSSTIYFGGSFAKLKVNSTPVDRANLAAVDVVSGDPTDWNPGATPAVGYLPYTVYGLKLADSTLFVYGNLGTLGAITRKGAGAVLTTVTSGYTTSWNPNLAKTYSSYGVVHSLALSGDTVYLGGDFNKIRTSTTLRNNIAAITRTGLGTVLAWNPNIKSPFYGASSHPNGVFSLIVTEGVVYAGGNFTMVGSTARSNLAAIDRTTGLATDWNPNVADGDDQLVYTLQAGNSLFVGGSFISVNGVARNGLAAIDLSTNSVTSWSPVLANDASPQTYVKHLQQYGSTIYVTGEFTTVGGQPRRNFAAISKVTGLPLDFLSTSPFGEGRTFAAIHQNKLYVSGNFTMIGDSARNKLACIDLTTGLVTGWNPRFKGLDIQAMAFSGSTVYFGGGFDSVGTYPRQGLAAVDDSLGNATTWDPNAGATSTAVNFYTMQVSGSTVYVGGQFGQIGIAPRTNLAAIDAATGVITAWNPNCSFFGNGSDGVYGLQIAGNTLYTGAWGLTSVGGIPRTGVAAIDIPTATATSWNPPDAFTAVSCLSLDVANQMVYFGGGFSTTAYDTVPNLAGYGDPTLIQPSTTTSMRSGWNLVSVPRVPSDFTRTALFPTAVDFYSYLSGSYTTPATLQNGEGYWALYSAATDNTISGSSFGSTSLTVPTGGRWVIIGSVTSPITASAITTSPAGQIVGGPYAYDGTSYVLATTLEPGKAYWVLINNPCTILLN